MQNLAEECVHPCDITGGELNDEVACRIKNEILSLWPNGPAWNQEDGSNISKMSELFGGIENAKFIADCKLLDEAYPCTSVDLIGDWERIFGLSRCFGPEPDIVKRQTRLCAWIAARDLVTCDDYVRIAWIFGFAVICQENFCNYGKVDLDCPDFTIPAPAPIIRYPVPDLDPPDCCPKGRDVNPPGGALTLTIKIKADESPGFVPPPDYNTCPDVGCVDETYPSCGPDLSDMICVFNQFKPRFITLLYEVISGGAPGLDFGEFANSQYNTLLEDV
jgi:hypothetical protein